MKKRLRNILIIAVAVVLIAAVTVMIVLVTREPDEPEPVRLTMHVPWSAEAQRAPVTDEILLFEQSYPWITVELQTAPMGDLNQLWIKGWPDEGSDLAALSVELPEPAIAGEAVPWTGSPWALYVNATAMQRAELWEDEVPASWRAGTLTLDELEEGFAALRAAGIAPVSVGGQFVWPFAAWVQHIGLVSGHVIVPGEAPYNDADLEEIIATWEDWQASGWLVENWLTIDWPSSVRKVTTGEAAMALLAGNMAAAFPPETSGTIVPVPFPSGNEASWTVGSLVYLAVPASSEHQEEARYLLDFFTSEGVTQRLTQRAQMLFYAASGARQPGRVYPSVTNDRDSNLMRYLEEYIRR